MGVKGDRGEMSKIHVYGEIEITVYDTVYISGVWGKFSILDLQEIEKKVLEHHQPSNDFSNWYTVRISAYYYDGDRDEDSGFDWDELSRKEVKDKVADENLKEYLVGFDTDEEFLEVAIPF